MLFTIVLLMAGAFLVGSIPFGFLIAKSKGIDIRTVGSGNIGATNVTRVLGNRLGYCVFGLDVLKGFVPGLVARQVVLQPEMGLPPQCWWFLAGIAAFLGHMFCPWLGFKGGKGIATGLGALLAAAPFTALASFTVFLVFLFPTRYVSLSSLVAAVALPVFGLLIPGEARELVPIYLLLSALVFYKHRDNIRRLRAGTESKFSFRASPTDHNSATTKPG
jgi:glycerol-3-phosphate acyltransferase PlsY